MSTLSELINALSAADIKIYGIEYGDAMIDTSINLTRSDVLSIQLSPYADTPFSLNHWNGESMLFNPKKTIPELIEAIKTYIEK